MEEKIGNERRGPLRPEGQSRTPPARVMCAMEFGFIAGSMGAGSGEKVRAHELAMETRNRSLRFLSGGARMMEGTISLMQLAKVSASVRGLG